MALLNATNAQIWQALKPYLPPGTSLTSVYRPAAAQLSFIVRKARAHGYRFSKPPVLEQRDTWEDALVFVRKKGYKVAAPGASNHQAGVAYDLSGPNLKKIEEAVRKAVAAGRITLLRTSKTPILPEPKNNCVHVEIEGAIIDFEPHDFA